MTVDETKDTPDHHQMAVLAGASSIPASRPPYRGVARRPLISTLGFVLLGATMVIGEEYLFAGLAAILSMAYLVAALVFFVRGAVIWGRHRDPPRPRAPRRVMAQRAPVPPEPPRLVHELAHHCVLCGRPLTNPESMRARVGSTCIKRYGPRYKMIRNVRHERWSALLAAAEAQCAAAQAKLDVAHRRSLDVHQRDEAAWHEGVQSPVGVERRAVRTTGRRLVAISVASHPAVFSGIAVALPLVGA